MLIAVAGHAGAGKTTAVEYLRGKLNGRVAYAGGYVRAEVAKRGLDVTPDNERRVRVDLRRELGDGALAQLALPEIEALMREGPVLLDAVCTPAERAVYFARLPVVVVVGILASYGVRVERVASRPDRVMTPTELAERDRVEIETLRLDEVLDVAHHRLTNEGSVGAFETSLDALLRRYVS